MHCNNFRFLELDKHLTETLTEGQLVYIKGDDDEDAILCTDSRTYEVVETETSNSLLLLEGIKFVDEIGSVESERGISKVTVHGIFYDYLEPKPGKPRLAKLNRLLNKTVYRGPEHESEIPQDDLVTFEDLVDTIQASRLELEQALQSLHVVTIKGNVRLLSFQYQFQVVSLMLQLIEENSWGLDEICYEETINALEDIVPKDILNSLFDLYTEESQVIDSQQLYRYKQFEVCQFLANIILSNSAKFGLYEFLETWQASVPEGMVTREEMLYGIAIVDKKSSPCTIWAFSEESLPENVIERFKILFNAKEKWTVPEISPYIK